MKKAILIAALFAVAGIANAQNAASTPATQPAAATEAAKPAEATAKVEGHKKAHAKKHVKHAPKKGDQAKAADTETVAKTGAGADQKTTSAPAK